MYTMMSQKRKMTLKCFHFLLRLKRNETFLLSRELARGNASGKSHFKLFDQIHQTVKMRLWWFATCLKWKQLFICWSELFVTSVVTCSSGLGFWKEHLDLFQSQSQISFAGFMRLKEIFLFDLSEISGPIILDTYRVIADFTKTSKHEINLHTGDLVEIVEKNQNGGRSFICFCWSPFESNGMWRALTTFSLVQTVWASDISVSAIWLLWWWHCTFTVTVSQSFKVSPEMLPKTSPTVWF